MDTTLEAGLDRLFGAGATAGMRLPTDAPGPAQAAPGRRPRGRPLPGAFAAAAERCATLAAEARDHYQRALDAQRQGNWALYGEEIKRLGDVLQRMEAARK